MAAVDLPARWWTRETVAVVTGGNTGIGLAIVRKLAQEAGITVVLAARDEGRGLMATQHLHKDGLTNVLFRKLDISKPQSVTDFAAWIKQTFGGLDILVNNAAVLHLDNAYEHALECIDTNYHGTKNCTETLLPLLKASPAGARIVNLSSRLAWIDMCITDKGLRDKLIDSNTFDQDTIDGLAEEYKKVCKAGDESAAAGYGHAYSFSKVLGNAYTRLLAQRVAAQPPNSSTVYVNCVDPGVVDTGMWAKFRATVDDAAVEELQRQGHCGPRPKTTMEGADSPVWMALFPPGGPSGKFWSDRREFSYVYGDA